MEEEIDDKLFCTILRYIYNENKRLLRIEEQINDNIRIEWDRDFIEDVLINDIIDIMKNHYEKKDIEYFLRSLPDDLISKIEHACGYVA